jgi:hypothetical protein
MKPIVMVFLLSCLTAGVQAQDKYLKDKEATADLSREVTELFKQNKYAEAFKELSAYWPLPQAELQELEDKTSKYQDMIGQRFGKAIGTLKVSEQTISDIAIKEIYLVRYENSAIRLIFTYYRNNNGWVVNAFKWDDNFEEEFK